MNSPYRPGHFHQLGGSGFAGLKCTLYAVLVGEMHDGLFFVAPVLLAMTGIEEVIPDNWPGPPASSATELGRYRN